MVASADGSGKGTEGDNGAPPRRRATRRRRPAAAKKATSESEQKPASSRRRRGTRAKKSAGKTEPTTPPTGAQGAKDGARADAGAADLAQLVAAQSALIERQTTLLQAVGEAQERSARLLERLAQQRPSGGEPEGLTVEVLPRLGIFVDVPNILYAAERSGVELDWGKVADFLSRGRRLVRAIAYAPISDDPAAKLENERFVLPFVDHGYRIVTKPLKRFTGGGVKANFDVELAIDVLMMADRLDVIVLVSGDGDFRRVVDIVTARGVRVEVMAFGQSTATELRAAADRYIDFAAYIPELSHS